MTPGPAGSILRRMGAAGLQALLAVLMFLLPAGPRHAGCLLRVLKAPSVLPGANQI